MSVDIKEKLSLASVAALMSTEVLQAMPVGIAFGLAAHLSGVSNPQVLRAQFIFDKQIMVKVVLGALAGSAFSFAALSAYNPQLFNKVREAKGFGDKGVVTGIVGGLLQGAGMAIAATCPGMVFAQIGAGVRTAPVIYIGALMGALTYSLLHPWLKPYLELDFAKTLKGRFASMHLEESFNGKYTPVVLSFGAVLLAIALGLEFAIPYGKDAKTVLNGPRESAILPTLGGLVLGSLQIPLFFTLQSFLGASSGYTVLSSQVLRYLPEESIAPFTYAKNHLNSKARWQLGLGLGIIVGAAIASIYASVNNRFIHGAVASKVSGPHVSVFEAFIGGYLLVFGARLAGGCASGHGITGMPSFHVVSWVVVPSLFLGGIITGTFLSKAVMTRSEYLLQPQ